MAENVSVFEDDDGFEIDRRDTGFRIGLSVLFVIISEVLGSLLGLIVVFDLAVAMITRRPPSPRVRELANRILSYSYRIGRYLTYNESRVPFPFAEFPPAVEPEDFRPNETESKALGLRPAERRRDDDDDPYEDDR